MTGGPFVEILATVGRIAGPPVLQRCNQADRQSRRSDGPRSPSSRTMQRHTTPAQHDLCTPGHTTINRLASGQKCRGHLLPGAFPREVGCTVRPLGNGAGSFLWPIVCDPMITC